MNADCAGAQQCVDGACAEPDECADDRDCLGDRICIGQGVASRCQAPCTVADCPRALTCILETGRCEEELLLE